VDQNSWTYGKKFLVVWRSVSVSKLKCSDVYVLPVICIGEFFCVGFLLSVQLIAWLTISKVMCNVSSGMLNFTRCPLFHFCILGKK